MGRRYGAVVSKICRQAPAHCLQMLASAEPASGLVAVEALRQKEQRGFAPCPANVVGSPAAAGEPASKCSSARVVQPSQMNTSGPAISLATSAAGRWQNVQT